MLVLAFVAGWLVSSPVVWTAEQAAYVLPLDWMTTHRLIWEFSWRCLATAVRFGAVGFVYVLGLREDWRLSGLWVWIGTLMLSALDRRTFTLGALPVLTGGAAAFLGTWLAHSREEHPAVERLREILYWLIPQGG